MPSWEFGKITGSIFQDSRTQFFTSHVKDELAFAPENYGRDPEWIKYRMDELFARLKIEALKARKLNLLSSGEKQKVAMASAQMNDPEIYILDEPTSGLDEANMNRVIEIISEQAARGCSVIIISHDYEFISRVSDCFIYLSDKTIQQDFPMNRDSFQSMVACLNSPLP